MTDPVVPPAAAPATSPRRVHPVTPLVQAANVLPVGFLVLVVWGGAGLDRLGGWAILAALGLSLVLAAVVGALQYLAWTRLTFWFDGDGDLRVDSGVLSRRQRRLQLSRLQSVDVAQPLVARIFGMATVKVEVAGVGDSRVQLAYLSHSQAMALRHEILARAAGLRHDAGEAPEQVLAIVPTRELIVSLLLRGVTVMLLLITVLLVVGTTIASGPAGLLLILVTGGVPLLSVFTEFTKYFNFTVAESPDGLRLRYGLLRTESQTVPPGRVQAIEFVEPLLWRRRGWARVRLNIAGVGGSSDGSGQTQESVLIPVAPLPLATSLVARILPGVDLADLPLAPVPDRARRRSPIQWRRLGVGWDDRVFVARRGRIGRHLAIIPHARTQSVRVTQGPWERVLGLASMHVDSTPGPVQVSALHREATQARLLAEEQVVRARAARAAAGPDRWMRRDPSTRPPVPEEPE